ncbi:MAG TPA: hypothetical protein VIQ54_18990 [Polyangia bacterium]
MRRRAWISSFVVIVVAGRAYGQSSAPQPTAPPPNVVAPQQPQNPARHTLCFSGRPFECASVLLLEVGGRAGHGAVGSADAGLLIHDGLNAYGATAGVVGISGAKDDANLWFAARYRRYLGTWGVAGDVSAGYAGGPALEVALGWGDVVALTAGINRYELKAGGHDVVAGVGLRVGSIVIGGLFYLIAVVSTSAR